MMHLFRPAEPPLVTSPPVGSWWGPRLAVAAAQSLARAGRLIRRPTARRLAANLVVLVGLVVQGALLLTAAYLIDLAISLMELWAELARQHLRITL